MNEDVQRRNYWVRRATTAGLSRRRFAGGFAGGAAGIAGLALVGCGGSDDANKDTATTGTKASPSASGQGETVKKGGHFTLHMGGSPRSLDPHFDTFPYNTAITTNTNNGLLQFSPDLSKVQPDLATAMPEQPDPLSYTFKIQQGVKFQNVDPVNGREFTSEDVKYSIERQMTDQAGKFQHAYFFLGHVDKIETPDKYTVTVKTNKPFAPFISYIASPWTLMICKEVVDKDGDLTERAIGTGPFILKEWQKDVKFELVKNPDYFKKDLPNIDALTWVIAADPATSATLFISKGVDAAVLAQSELQRVKDARPDAHLEDVPSQFWKQFRMPPTTKDQPYPKPFDDIRVREAIVRAVDKKQILDLVYSGDGIATYGPILPVYEQWALKKELVPFDLKKAKDLLGQAGQSGGFSGDMIWASTAPQLDQISEVIKQQMGKIGVTLDLKPMELAAYYNQTYSYKYTFSQHTPLNNPDPDENLSAYFGKGATYYKHFNQDIFDAIDKQSEELDTAKRQQLVQDAQVKIVNDFPMVFLFTTNNHNFTDPRVKGWDWSKDLYNGRVETVWLNS